jgi:hypothetical protein
MGVIPTGPNAMAGSEWLLGVLRGAGLPDQVAAYALDLLTLYVTAIAFEEGTFDNELDPAELDAYVADVRERMRSMPADEFPNLVAMTDALTRDVGDERFEFGLDILVAGLAAQAR